MLGVGEMLGGWVMGQIVDRFNSRVGVVWNVITIVFACCLSIW